ncbi:MAG: hypothetical protein AB8B96_09470 [Lysobacterales bacterium]
MDRKIRVLTIGQIVAAALTFAYSLTYPGIMVVISAGLGLCYLIAAISAHRQFRPATWVALLFSVFTLWMTTLLIGGFRSRGYSLQDVLSTWPIETIIMLSMLLGVFLLLLVVVLMHLWCWRWLVFGAPRNPKAETIK